MNVVQIVTIKNKIPLFKGNDKAERIELIQLEENDFDQISYDIKFKTPKVYFDKVFNNIEDIKQECESIFKNELIEGVVIRDENHNFSCKFMNNEYDSKK